MRKAVLSIQHLLAMFGATVLVPLLTGLDPSVAIFCAGIGTLIFHKCTDLKVPVFLGSSFAFISVINQVKNTFNGDLSYAQGGIMVAGLLYIIMSMIIKVAGPKKVKKYFPPQVTGAMIMIIGLNLLPTAVEMAMNNIIVAIVTLSIAVGINKFGRGSIKQFSVIIAIFIGIAVSAFIGITDFSAVSKASLFAIPNFSAPKFSLKAIIIIAPVVLAVFMEHVGDITTNGAVVGKNFLEDPGLHKTLLGDGLATLVAGLIGGPANTTYGENTGVLELSRVHDPRVIRIAAVFAVILSFIPKMAEVIGSMPSAIIGGVSFMLYGMISAIGVRNVVENQVDLTKSRNLVIAAVILVCGLGFSGGLTFEAAGTSVTLTGLAIAAIAGVLLNVILPGNDYQFGKNLQGDINRGVAINPNPKKRQE